MTRADSSASPALPACWLVLAACASGSVYFWTQGDAVTAAALLAVAIAGVGGYRVGALYFAAFFGGTLLGFHLAPRWADPLAALLAESWGATAGNHWLALGGCFLAVLCGTLAAARLGAWILLPDRPWLQGWNRWLGFSCGAAQGVGLTLLLLGGLLAIERDLGSVRFGDPGTLPETVAQRVVEVAQQTRRSMIGPWVVAANPFDHVPRLREQIRGWNHPQHRERFP